MMWPIVNRLDWGVDPFLEMNRLQRQMNRLFDGYMDRSQEFPAVNVWSNGDQVVVTADVPGVEAKDVEITVTGSVLTMEGERKAEQPGAQDTLYRQERDSGKFVRSVRLPFEVENDKVEAHYRNGILHITLPRSEATKPRKIQIEAK